MNLFSSSFILLVALFFCCIHAQVTISNCTALRSVVLDDASVSYALDRDIDCSFSPFVPLGNTNTQPFRGILDGKGFRIRNVLITDDSGLVGIFRTATNAIFQNLKLVDFNITTAGTTSNIDYFGALFGLGENVTLQDISMETSSLTENTIQVNNNGASYVGAVAGLVQSGRLVRVSVTNTSVSAPNTFYVGGVTNFGKNTPVTGEVYEVNNVFNFGFPSNPNRTVAFGNSYVGGVFGRVLNSNVTNSGIFRGRILLGSGAYAAGFAGEGSSSNYDGIFVRPDVSVAINRAKRGIESSGRKANTSKRGAPNGNLCGGVFGLYSTGNLNVVASNIYSRASSVTCVNAVGGFSGAIFTFSSNLTLNNVYAATTVNVDVGQTAVGALIGDVLTTLPNNVTFNQVYFDNTIANDTRGTGFNCSALFNNVVANFPSAVWGGDRLRIEPGFSAGVCNCQSGCPTIPPTTIVPTNTSVPTTAPTNSPTDFSGVYNVDATCPSTQSCCCPRGKVSVTQQNGVVSVSISEVTGNCTRTGSQTVTFTLTSSTSGTGSFNGQTYTFTYSNQRLRLSSTGGCSTEAKCESGNCRSLPSGASLIGGSLMLMMMFLGFLFF